MHHWILIVVTLVLAGCQKENDPIRTSRDEANLDMLTSSLNTFQWQLFQKTIALENTQENLNISPLSVAVALYMAFEGAAGETKLEMAKALDLPDSELSFSLGEAYQDLVEELNKGDALLSLSNAVFWDKSRITPHDDFLDYTSSFFTAGAFDLTFKDPDALAVINAWVNTSTQGRIEKIIEEISPEEVLFIINALYFKDDWKYPFPIEATQLRDFTRSDGSIAPTDMMHQDISNLRFYQGSDFSAVELPFADSSYTLTLLLPIASSSPDELVAELSATRLQSLFDKDLKQGRILLNMPKFEIEYKLLLNDVLKSMGMQLAFDPNRANLSKLGSAPEGNLYISRVNHKTYLKVDEKGAEGAAVTSIGVGVTSLPPQLNFDRPHVFVLRNQGTGSLIFAGKIEDPSGS